MSDVNEPELRREALDPITVGLEEVVRRIASLSGGRVADYIPQLTKADPEWFGLSLVSMEGHCYDAGDSDVPFTIQSISKPFVFALALADRGLADVSSRVGSEPSGEAFNAISLEPQSGRPANPMINAGAILTSSLVRAADATERFDRIREMLSAFAGRQLTVDEDVFASERATGDRNRALGYLMRNAGSLDCDVEEALEVYFRQCSVSVTTTDLAVMAATLANGGVNPCTQDVVVDRRTATLVLTIMATCGMYDYAGEWLLRAGLPAKSGVSGGLVAASPGQFGIGVFSPPLDERGNSLRGVTAIQDLAGRFNLHMMHNPRRAAGVVLESTDTAARRSGRHTAPAELATLERHGKRIVVLALHGEIEFSAAEAVLWRLRPAGPQHAGERRWLVLDLSEVTLMRRVATRLLDVGLSALRTRGDVVLLSGEADGRSLDVADGRYAELGLALAAAEGQLIAEAGGGSAQ